MRLTLFNIGAFVGALELIIVKNVRSNKSFPSNAS